MADLPPLPAHALADPVEQPARLAERRLFPAREGWEQQPPATWSAPLRMPGGDRLRYTANAGAR
jgi:hypothetical protein